MDSTKKTFRQVRKQFVRALADPDTFREDMSQKFHWGGSTAHEGAKTDRGHTDDGPLAFKDADVACFSLQDAINQRKSHMPLRLICTEDGKLYHQDAVETRFRTEHAQFFEPMASSPKEHTMTDAMQTSFAYTMFSHRWDREEPLFKDLEGSDVSSLAESPGTTKLQQFCSHAREHGFRWAWSDTCCIDKNSTQELQESIVSMFRWYKNSDLTIIYLGDVFENSIEALENSAWFMRGWTLQELIAPNRLVFFKSDWTLLITSIEHPLDNYKLSRAFREQITKITGIEDEALIHFDPASRQPNIRQRMSWAARRKTTKVEDVAYCLMGIFDVQIPVMYGEGANNAFNRLQLEIMGKSDDSSLFDWTGMPGSNTFLASSPACFDPFKPPVVQPVPTTMRIAEMMRKYPMVPKIQHEIDRLSVNFTNMQLRFGVSQQHPRPFMAGAGVHCHGLEYRVLDVEESKEMSAARKAGHEGHLFRYHIIAESLHPMTVTLAEPITLGFGRGRIHSESMCIFRVWDHALIVGSTDSENEQDHPLRKPFAAHLLISRAGGIYKRIRVKEHIVGKLAHPLDFRMNVHLCNLTIE